MLESKPTADTAGAPTTHASSRTSSRLTRGSPEAADAAVRANRARLPMPALVGLYSTLWMAMAARRPDSIAPWIQA
jgi:hypothetical protein